MDLANDNVPADELAFAEKYAAQQMRIIADNAAFAKLTNCGYPSFDLYPALKPYFPEDELNNIENAFEGVVINYEYEYEDERHFSEAAVSFNKGVRSPRKRMERIMRNIIRHNGRFVP